MLFSEEEGGRARCLESRQNNPHTRQDEKVPAPLHGGGLVGGEKCVFPMGKDPAEKTFSQQHDSS